MDLFLSARQVQAIQLQLKGRPLSRFFEITDPGLAAYLADPRRRRILLAFVGQERNLTEASTALSMRLNLLHHHVKRLLAFGAIKVVREEPRAGRAIRYYRGANQAFFIPTRLMASTVGASLARELRLVLDGAAGEAAGMMLDLDEAGRPRLRFIGEEIESIPWEVWRILRLGRSAADAFSIELKALIRRYELAATDSGPAYLFHAALIEREDPWQLKP